MTKAGEAAVPLSREELYALIWAEPLNKVAARFGIAVPKLSAICAAHAIARPDNGHWLRIDMGKPLRVHPLEPAPAGVSDTIVIAPATPKKTRGCTAVGAAEGEVAPTARLAVPERLVRPHPLVAEWIATREREVRKKDTVYDPRLKRLVMPVPLTPADRRRLLVASTIFKAVEKRGVTIKAGARHALQMTLGDEQIEFQLRYRLKRGRRDLTAAELRWRGDGAQTWAYELYETNSLVFEIKTWLPRGIRTEWEDSKRGTIEAQLDDVIAGIMAAFPALETLRREREEDRRRCEAAARVRREREDACKLDVARFRRLLELAADWREAEIARAFVAALREKLTSNDADISGTDTAEWLDWAERKIERHDRLASDPASILQAIAEVTLWTYRD